MSTLAASGALPIVRYVCVRLSYSSPYRMPAPVDHIYHNKWLNNKRCEGLIVNRGVKCLLRVFHSSGDNDVKRVHILCESRQHDSN